MRDENDKTKYYVEYVPGRWVWTDLAIAKYWFEHGNRVRIKEEGSSVVLRKKFTPIDIPLHQMR